MKSESFGDELYIFERSVSELTNIYNEVIPPCNLQYESGCLPTSPESWYGGITNIKQAEDLLSQGWQAGAEKALILKDGLEASIPMVKSRKRKPVWCENGADLDVDRALAGQWDTAYRSMVTELSPGGSQCVTLNAAWGGNCNLTSDQLFWSGACMLVVSDILENAGYSVRLNAINKISFYTGKFMLNSIIIKDHGEPLRVDALASITAHAGIFRTYGFRCIAQAPFDIGRGFGRSEDWSTTNPILNRYGQGFESNNIQINDCYSQQAAISEIKRIITTIQGED